MGSSVIMFIFLRSLLAIGEGMATRDEYLAPEAILAQNPVCGIAAPKQCKAEGRVSLALCIISNMI